MPAGRAIPSFFFQVQKLNRRQSKLIEKLWMTSTNQSVRQLPLPPAIFFFFSFLICIIIIILFYRHTHTSLWQIRCSPSPTMHRQPEKQHLKLQYVHTRYVQQYQGGARQKWFTPRERTKKLGKNKNTKICALLKPSTNGKKDWHWIQKYHHFYISNCHCWLLSRNTLIFEENSSTERPSIF